MVDNIDFTEGSTKAMTHDLDLTTQLHPERAELLKLLRALAPSDWALPTECPEWTVKGIALHILGDDLSLLSRQRDAGPQGLFIYAETHPGLDFPHLLDGFNEQWVTAATFLSSEVIIDMLQRVGELSAAFYSAVGLDTVANEPVGFFGDTSNSPYWKVIAREYVERFIHQHQIRRAIGAPNAGEAFVASAAEAVWTAIGGHAHAVDAPVGATAALAIDSVGRWILRRDADGWSRAESFEGTATVTFALGIESATRLLTRAADARDLANGLRRSGDDALAANLLAAAAPLLGRPVPANN